MPRFQPDANFGRVLAAYGWESTVGSLVWGIVFEVSAAIASISRCHPLGRRWLDHVCVPVTASDPKHVVGQLIDRVMNGGSLDAIEEICSPELADSARRWIEPFRAAFPDLQMEIVELVAEGDRVAGRFRCSATHRGEWRGRRPTGRRFEEIDEVYFFTVRDGEITGMWGLEDTRERERQLGLDSRIDVRKQG